VTLSWTVVAAVLLARGVRRPAMRVAGMVLVAAAVAKLILFDLVALALRIHRDLELCVL
jgi:uncharacterized membrane protein